VKGRKGHILILVENLPVPFDRRVWMEALALTESGYKVSVISPCPLEETQTPNRVIEGVHVFRYPMPATTSSKFSFIKEFAYCLWHTRRLTAQIWGQDPFDVIQSCNPPDTFWMIGMLYKRLGVRYVFDHHDLCPELYETKFERRDILYRALQNLERWQFRIADAVISSNESYRKIAIERGKKNPRDVSVVRSGPDLARFRRVRSDPAMKRGRRYLGVYLGVMGPQDGVDYGLRAVRHALDAGLYNTTFAFIGNGDSFHDMVSLSRRLGLEDHVQFTGRVADFVLQTYLSTADFGIAPDPKSPLNNLSTMNKIVEYMAMGLPIVSFDLKESRISAGDAAIYVENNDPEEMGQAIIDLVSDEPRRIEMSQLGQNRVANGLSWAHSQRILVNLYDRLLGVSREPQEVVVHKNIPLQNNTKNLE